MKRLGILFLLVIMISTLCIGCAQKPFARGVNTHKNTNKIAPSSDNPDLSQISDVVKTYGVWDRSGKYTSSGYPFLKGVAINLKWSEIEPKQGQFQWKDIDKTLKQTLDGNQYVYFHLNIGPDSPKWVYDNGVPQVILQPYQQKNGNTNKWDVYPYYLSSEYEQILNKTITSIANHIYGLDDKYFNRIVFIQVSTGCTGDECPYKGEPVDSKYQISKEQWSNYRIKVFDMYRKNFQRDRRSFYLLFNDFDKADFPKENSWIQNNITNIGGKGSVLPRGYNLTGMQSIIDEIKPYTVAPQGQFMLTRAEMDQSWRKGYFMLNVPMNLYWSMLNGLDGGLGIWDISKGILNESENPDVKKIIPIFEFFNTYAGDVFPEKAQGAFIAFRKGLDSSDKISYPEDKFGSANKDNIERYVAICNEYKEFGAQMDDIEAVTYGQVKQRAEQKGFNDSGWGIPTGNYERFITQIDPDKTDQAYWCIGGAITTTTHMYSRFARGFDNKKNKDAIYLNVDDRFYSLKNGGTPEPLSVKIIYYDKGNGSFSLMYDAVGNSNKNAIQITKEDSGQWKEKTITINDAAFNNRGINSSDISLINTDQEDDIFHMIEIRKIQ
jgi:hypothetical protein